MVEVEITFEELRRVVIALHTCGIRLQTERGLTLAHGDVGQEYLQLATRLDALVRDCGGAVKVAAKQAHRVARVGE